MPSVRRESRSHRTGSQPMCGTFSPSASSSPTGPASRPSPTAPPSSVLASKSSCRPRQMPRIGAPSACRSATQLVEAELADPLHRPRKGADARQDQPVGGPHLVRIGGDRCAGADMLERLLHRAQGPHTVAEDRDPRHPDSVPFVEGTPVSSGSTETATRSARAKALKDASIMWWALLPERTQMCRVSLALLATARKNSSASSLSKPAIETTGSSAAKSQ